MFILYVSTSRRLPSEELILMVALRIRHSKATWYEKLMVFYCVIGREKVDVKLLGIKSGCSCSKSKFNMLYLISGG